MGGIGIATYLLFVGAIFVKLGKAVWNNPKHQQLLLSLTCGGLAIFIFELFNTSYYKGKMWFPIALAIAAMYLITKRKNAKK